MVGVPPRTVTTMAHRRGPKTIAVDCQTMQLFIATIPSPSSNTFDIGPFVIHYYGILMGLGVLAAVVITARRFERFGGDPKALERILLWVIVIGFLGARLAFVSTRLTNYTDRPWAILYLWEGGIAMFGGITAGTITAVVMMRRAGMDFWRFADAVAIGLPAAQVIARWGNYMNQELFGTPTTLPWGLEIDAAHRPAQYAGAETFHPTFLYESLWNLAITIPVLLWLERRGRLPRGALLGAYFVLYGIIRFLDELIRTDTTFRFLGLSKNGWVSIAALIAGIAIIRWRGKAPDRDVESATAG